MFLDANYAIFPILFAVVVIFVPVVILAIICFIKLIVKQCKRNRKKIDTGLDYENLFGGKDNIENIQVNMTRVNVTVKDLELVKMDELKAIGVQMLINGNILKCQSEVLLEAVKNNK